MHKGFMDCVLQEYLGEKIVMNWLHKVSFRSFSGSMTKIAQSMFSGCTFSGPTTINMGDSPGFRSNDNSKDVYTSLIRKNDRYASDPYRVWISKSANNDGHSLVLEVKAERDGMVAYSDIWKYGSGDSSVLENMFNALIDVTSQIKQEVELNNLPTALIVPLFKKSTRFLDLGNRESSNGVGPYRWDQLDDKEYDWRSTIYGNRYPGIVPSEVLKVHWQDSVGEEVISDGVGRNRSYRISR